MSSTVPRKPRAYRFAERLKPDLHRHFTTLKDDLNASGHHKLLKTFQAMVREGQPSINMGLPECIRFLTTGKWLNIYEAIQLDTGKTGDELEEAVREKIAKSYDIRRKINSLFRFRRDTHFAALNVGGAGATGYGVCCVVFDLKQWHYSTCFDGDYELVINDNPNLHNLGTIEDIDKVAALKYAEALRQHSPESLDISKLREQIEAPGSQIIIYRHGAVKPENAIRIVMPKDNYSELEDKGEQIFLDFMALVKNHEMPLLTV